MKNFFSLLLVVVIGVVAYKVVTGGKLQRPRDGGSPQVAQIRELERKFDRALQHYGEAGRAGAVGGMDMSSEADAAVDEARAVEQQLAALRPGLTDQSAIQRAEELQSKINTFYQKTK